MYPAPVAVESLYHDNSGDLYHDKGGEKNTILCKHVATTTKLKNKLTFYNSRKALTFGTIFRLSLTFAFAAFSRFAFVASLPELQLHCFCRFLAQNSTLDLKEEGQNHSFAEEKLLPTS